MEMPDRNPSEALINQLVELELAGFSAWDSEDFDAAIKTFSQEVETIRKAEREEGRGIHKGAALHNLALSYAFKGEMSEALINFLLAYVEDTLGTGFGEEDEADAAPAYRVLRYLFRLRIDAILEINKKSHFLKKNGKMQDLIDPMQILSEVAQSLGVRLDDHQKWVKVFPKTLSKKVPLGFPQPWEHRVFIGGPYRDKESRKVLYKIKEGVRRKDFRYVPVMGSDIFVEKDVRHRTLLLLHTCKWAIFDVNFPAGQLVEIERSLDYETRRLILYRNENGKIPDTVSFMTRTIPQNLTKFVGYDKIEEIPKKIEEFLPKFEEAEE